MAQTISKKKVRKLISKSLDKPIKKSKIETEFEQKFKMSNATKDLKTLIDSFFDVLIALTVVGNIPLTPVTIGALNALKTEFGQLLKS